MLAVEKIRSAFEAALAEDQRVVVSAPTGSGKSTRIPIWLSELYSGPVLVVEPRRVACRALAEYLASQRRQKVGADVGYRVRYDDRSSAATQVLLVTPGVALRMLVALRQGDTRAWPFAAVVLDEFHERGWEVDLLLALLMEGRPWQGHHALVVTSATLDGPGIARYLKSKHLQSEGRQYPVEIAYDEDIGEPSGRDLALRVARVVREAARSCAGEILVFLPGKGEISACWRELKVWAGKHDIDVVRVHASVPSEDLHRSLRDDYPRRRVFLATNVAETSLTLPGVELVVDAGLVRMRLHRAGRAALALAAVSQASADQRAGRAGRVAPGRCLRLWGRSAKLVQQTPPELLRMELDEVILRAAGYGLDEEGFAALRWLDPPPGFAVERARARLQRRQTVAASGQLTELGREVLEMPVGVEEGLLLASTPVDMLPVMAALVALLERPRELFKGLDGLDEAAREEVYEAREALLSGCHDEVQVQLRVLFGGSVRRHLLYRSRLAEVRQLYQKLCQSLGIEASQKVPEYSVEQMAETILGAWPEAGFVLRPRALKQRKKRGPDRGSPWSNGELELMVENYRLPFPKRGEGKSSSPRAGLVLSHTWISRGLKVRGHGRMLLPVGVQVLGAAGLGEIEIEQPKLKGGRVLAKVQRSLAGVVLTSEEQSLKGAELRRACAQLLLEGRWLPGAAAALRDRFHLLKVLGGGVFPELDAFVLGRLEELGFEASEELSLIDVEDLLPDLAAAGYSPMEQERAAQDFPRIWRFQGADYLCEVSMSNRRVYLVPANAAARKAKVPPAAMVPRFRGFGVYYRKASRELKLR